MKIQKAVITAAGKNQRKLPLQTLIDVDGIEKTVLEILIEEIKNAGISDIAVIVHEGDKDTYQKVLTEKIAQPLFIEQINARGYGHAIYIAKKFVRNQPFLHLVGDHLYIRSSDKRCAKHLVEEAEKQACSISTVQATRESLIPYFGVVGGSRVSNSHDLYEIDKVIEKPMPTEAEQKLIVPGLRVGHYLCFFGMHILTPTIFEILEKQLAASTANINLSNALAELCVKEKYLALEKQDMRFDVGSKYGLMKAQIALALNGNDRDQVLADLLEFFTMKELNA